MRFPENKIALTGGHAATTALATIEALKKEKDFKWDISWIGSRRAVEGKSGYTLEFKVFPSYGIKCYSIITGRVQKRFSRYSIISLFKIPFGFVHALYLLFKIRPRVILSFGGFAAFPVVAIGWLLGIPVIIHEQTIAIGLANKFSIPFATKIAISRKESRKYYPDRKTVLTGNPVREAFFKISQKGKITGNPVIYATGGSRGSQIFNYALRDVLPKLLKTYTVIHQTGDIDFKKLEEFRKTLPASLKKKYEVKSTINPMDVPSIFKRADIVIGRAGANTVAEVIAASRPAIFIPISWSRYDEQNKNANFAKNVGFSAIISEDELSPRVFLETIKKVCEGWNKEGRFKKGKIHKLDLNASKNLAALCGEVVK